MFGLCSSQSHQYLTDPFQGTNWPFMNFFTSITVKSYCCLHYISRFLYVLEVFYLFNYIFWPCQVHIVTVCCVASSSRIPFLYFHCTFAQIYYIYWFQEKKKKDFFPILRFWYCNWQLVALFLAVNRQGNSPSVNPWPSEYSTVSGVFMQASLACKLLGTRTCCSRSYWIQVTCPSLVPHVTHGEHLCPT